MPMMPFIGVRISWLMFARNSRLQPRRLERGVARLPDRALRLAARGDIFHRALVIEQLAVRCRARRARARRPRSRCRPCGSISRLEIAAPSPSPPSSRRTAARRFGSHVKLPADVRHRAHHFIRRSVAVDRGERRVRAHVAAFRRGLENALDRVLENARGISPRRRAAPPRSASAR